MRIRRAVLDAIVGHARADDPLECCGLLLGTKETIDESRPAANLRASKVAFQVDPAGHFDAIRTARATGRAVIGAYHSHPAGPPRPSATDVAEGHDPELLHLIVSLADTPLVSAYRIAGGTPIEVELDVQD